VAHVPPVRQASRLSRKSRTQSFARTPSPGKRSESAIALCLQSFETNKVICHFPKPTFSRTIPRILGDLFATAHHCHCSVCVIYDKATPEEEDSSVIMVKVINNARAIEALVNKARKIEIA